MKMQNSIINNIIEKLNKKEEIAPFLFLWGAPMDIEKLSFELSEKLGINKNFIFTFKDSKEKIKDIHDSEKHKHRMEPASRSNCATEISKREKQEYEWKKIVH